MTIIEVGQILQDMGGYGVAQDILQAKLGLLHGYTTDWLVLAQQFDTDPFSGIREWFANLVATGQLWALIIGFILGYFFRGFTSYG